MLFDVCENAAQPSVIQPMRGYLIGESLDK
jgi:hypothetical protein